MSLHVLVIGGGIGGLTLAQRLRKLGVSVAVFERERTRSDWVQGYRIQINSAGSRALHESLPPGLWDAFVASAGRPPDGIAFLTEKMKELAFIEQPNPPDPAVGQYPVSRVKLRDVLLTGLDNVVHFDKEFVRYDRTPEGLIRACFADGTWAVGDVLIGADGVHSKVRQQYLPQAKVVDSGVVGISGKFLLSLPAQNRLPRPLLTRMNLILPPKACGMFVAQFIRGPGAFDRRNDDGARSDRGLLADDLSDHVFWALLARREDVGINEKPRQMEGADLQRIALRTIAGWHPELRRVVAESDPATVSTVPLQTSVPVPPWEPTNATLLGDAIHTMTPLGGLGGNSALRDAHLLGTKLGEVDQGRSTLLPAIGEYEAAMVDYGFDAVRRSLRLAQLTVSNNVFARAAFRTVLQVADKVPPLEQFMFRIDS